MCKQIEFENKSPWKLMTDIHVGRLSQGSKYNQLSSGDGELSKN